MYIVCTYVSIYSLDVVFTFFQNTQKQQDYYF